MRTRFISSALSLTLCAVAGFVPASATPVDTPLSSGNVTLLGNIPEAGAIGGQVKVVHSLLGDKRYFIMTSVRGVSAYNIDVPEAPVLVSHLPLPHFENEDVDFGGDVLIVSQDPQWFFAGQYGRPDLAGGLYLIDLSKLPLMTFAYVNPATGNRWVDPVMNYSGHTTSCVDAACSYAYVNGSYSVTIADLRDRAHPRVAGTFNSAVGSSHDAQVDASGLFWMVGSGGIAAYDTTDPINPRLVVPVYGDGLSYHHNSGRPRATEWTPRTTANFNDPTVRPGEALLITEEEIWGQTACINQGRFATSWLRDTDSLTAGAVPKVARLDTWSTELAANLVNPSPLCSAHYFDERNGIVAIAWYEEGTRLLDVSNPRDIRQIGYYINKTSSTWAEKWIGPGTAEGKSSTPSTPRAGSTSCGSTARRSWQRCARLSCRNGLPLPPPEFLIPSGDSPAAFPQSRADAPAYGRTATLV